MVGSHGCFVWYELTTTDAEAAKAFYADVVGWSLRDASMPGAAYTLFTAGEVPVAGLTGLSAEARKMGAQPRWTGYVGVDDVDATTDRLRRLGGTVYVPPTDVPDVSRFSVVADPQAATLALVKGLNSGQEQPAALSSLGHVGWHELSAVDWEQAFAFYGELFGWQKVDADFGGIGTYLIFSAGGQTDRRHVHQAADGADAVLALLLQCRRHRRGGEARQGRRRQEFSRARSKREAATGSSDARILRAPCSR